MGTIADNKQYWQDYDWGEGGEEWSGPWGSSFLLWTGSIFPRIASHLPTGALLEIAPGYGRMTRYLLPACTEYHGVDLADTCVEACKKRFANETKAEFVQGNGKSLEMIDDDSVDFAFSWDSLVHANTEVLEAYVHELSRKLKPGAYAFLHHSNLGSLIPAEQQATHQDKHGRDPTMSHQELLTFCKDAGMHCRSQELATWGERILKDCISVIRRPKAGEPEPETRITEHHMFVDEAGNFLRIQTIYEL